MLHVSKRQEIKIATRQVNDNEIVTRTKKFQSCGLANSTGSPCNHNSFIINFHKLTLLFNFLFNFIDGGILRDRDEKFFQKKIEKSFKSKIDIIITSGAVSAGKHDFVPHIIKKFIKSA